MKKTEIVQLTIVILAISIIVQSTRTLFQQLAFSLRVGNNYQVDIVYLFILIFGSVLLFGIAGFIFYKSEKISKFIIKEDKEINLSFDKDEIINLALVIMCLYFIIALFPSFFGSVQQLIFSFFDNYTYFKDIYPGQIWILIVYVSIFVILRNSKKVSSWLLRQLKNN